MATTKKLDQAMTAAAEYRLRESLGDVVACEQIEKTIEELVGYWDDSGARPVFRLPAPVREAMKAARSVVLPPIRVSPEEKKRLEQAAARAGVSLSQWLRSLGMREAREP